MIDWALYKYFYYYYYYYKYIIYYIVILDYPGNVHQDLHNLCLCFFYQSCQYLLSFIYLKPFIYIGILATILALLLHVILMCDDNIIM